jgi:uncharacterized protein YjiS (DUF1127 family)
MSLISFSQRATGARDRHSAGSLSSLLIAAGRMTFGRMMQKRQCRKDLVHVRELPDHLLRDIGIQRGDIVAAVYGGRGRA